jgi:hypothetical protein
MTGYKEYDESLEYTYTKSTALERLALYSPSDNSHFFFNLNKTAQKPQPVNPDEIIQRPNTSKFEEITSRDLGLYNKPPRE